MKSARHIPFYTTRNSYDAMKCIRMTVEMFPLQWDIKDQSKQNIAQLKNVIVVFKYKVCDVF
jgi:hypothetical protein